MTKKSSRRHLQKHIDKKLRNRLQLYFVISLIMILIVLYEIATSVMSFNLALLGIIVGIGLGIITARTFHISWDHNAKQIISRLDLFGGIILALYIVFAIFREKIIAQFVQGAAAGGVSMATVTGIMIGRVLGTRGKIFKVLKEQNIL